MNLLQQFEAHQGRVVHKPPEYLEIYERYFRKFVRKSVTVFELGVSKGGSLQLWQRYFGANVLVVGVDCEPTSAFSEPNILVRIGHQENGTFLRSLVSEFGSPDIVIDDAGHRAMETCVAFKTLYPLVRPGGIYAVEDVGTQYLPEYGGGLHHPDSFVELTKGLIDEMHAASRGMEEPTEFMRHNEGIHIYEHLFIFEKNCYTPHGGQFRGGEQQ